MREEASDIGDGNANSGGLGEFDRLHDSRSPRLCRSSKSKASGLHSVP